MNREKTAAMLDALTQLAMVGFVGSLTVSIAFTQTSLGIGWIAWLLKCLVEKRWNGFKTPMDFGFGLFLAVALLSSAFSLSPGESFLSLKKFYLLSAVYFIGYNIKNSGRMLELIRLFLLVTALTGIYGLIMFAFGYQPRLLATQGMAMTSGGIFMMAGLLSVAWHQYSFASIDKPDRILSIVSSGMLFVCLILTRTVSSWFGFIIGIFTSLKTWGKRAIVMGLALVMLAGVLVGVKNLRWSFMLFYGNKSTSWDMRLSMWRMGWDLIKERPMLGTGTVDLGHLLKDKMTPADELVWQNIPIGGHLHNNFIHIAVTMGLLGLSAFIFMWVSVFAMVIKLIGSKSHMIATFARGIFTVVIGFLISGLAEWNFGDSEVVTILWFVVGLALSAWHLEKTDENHSKYA